MDEESDGTRRLMHLAPAMMALTTGEFTFVIDDSIGVLHPEILHAYLANFLKYSVGLGSQLVVTTHDTTLLKQPFLRRDEVWFRREGDGPILQAGRSRRVQECRRRHRFTARLSSGTIRRRPRDPRFLVAGGGDGKGA